VFGRSFGHCIMLWAESTFVEFESPSRFPVSLSLANVVFGIPVWHNNSVDSDSLRIPPLCHHRFSQPTALCSHVAMSLKLQTGFQIVFNVLPLGLPCFKGRPQVMRKAPTRLLSLETLLTAGSGSGGQPGPDEVHLFGNPAQEGTTIWLYGGPHLRLGSHASGLSQGPS
jgi:hypothetical protein